MSGLENMLNDFKKDNPELTESLEIFNVSFEEYRKTLQILYMPEEIIITHSTNGFEE